MRTKVAVSGRGVRKWGGVSFQLAKEVACLWVLPRKLEAYATLMAIPVGLADRDHRTRISPPLELVSVERMFNRSQRHMTTTGRPSATRDVNAAFSRGRNNRCGVSHSHRPMLTAVGFGLG